MRRAIYPGSFDPPTYGHLDIIKRATKIFDEVIVTVAVNPQKKCLFSVKERIEMLKNITKELKNVKIESFDGLLVDYVTQKKCNVIIKGLRAVTDFEYEFQMALINNRLEPNIETVFLVTSEECSFLSSSIVKEVASLGGDVSSLVPEYVEQKLKKKFIRFRF